MVPCWSLRPSTSCFHGYAISSQTVSTTAPICVKLLPNSVTGRSRSSNAPLTRSDFNCSPGDGWSNELWLGSIETAVWPKISRLRSPAPKPGFTSPPCSCSLGDCPRNTTYTIKIRTLSDHRGTHATTPYLRRSLREAVADAPLLLAPPLTASRPRLPRSVDLRVHPALQPAGTDLLGRHQHLFLSVSVYIFANTNVYCKYYYRNGVLQRAVRFGRRASA